MTVAMIWIDRQLTFQRRYGTLVAVRALADAAGNADRLKRRVAGKIQIIGIDQCGSVFDLAAKGEGVALDRVAKSAAWF